MAVSILAAVLTQYPVGRLSDRIDRRTVIGGACASRRWSPGSLVAFSPMPRVVFLAAHGAVFSGSALTLYSLAVSHVNDKLEPAQMVAASSALLLINGMAAAVGPTLAGSLIAAFGPSAYFATLGTLTGGAHVLRPVAQEPPPSRCRANSRARSSTRSRSSPAPDLIPPRMPSAAASGRRSPWLKTAGAAPSSP